jgi:hypothetical protein
MASNLDDIIRQALKAGKSAAKKTAKKTGSASREAKKAANKAAAAAKRAEATAASRSSRAERKAINSKRYKSMQETGVAQEYGYGNRRITKAKEYYADELDKIFKVLEGTDRTINVSGKRRSALQKELKRNEEYLAKEGYKPLTFGEKKTIVKDFLASTSKANKAAEKRLTGLVEYTKGLEKSGGRKAIVDRGAARALQREMRKGGTKLPSILSDEVRASRAATTRKLEKLEEKARDKRLADKAKAKIGAGRDGGKKQSKKIVEQESSKRLRRAQEANAKDVVDPRVKKMSPEEYKRFRKREDANWKRLRSTPSPSNKRGMSSEESSKRLKELGDQSLNRRREPKLPPVKRTTWVRNKEGKLVPKSKRK